MRFALHSYTPSLSITISSSGWNVKCMCVKNWKELDLSNGFFALQIFVVVVFRFSIISSLRFLFCFCFCVYWNTHIICIRFRLNCCTRQTNQYFENCVSFLSSSLFHFTKEDYQLCIGKWKHDLNTNVFLSIVHRRINWRTYLYAG